jgi:amidase
MDLHDLTAVEQARAIRRGETSSVELTEHYLRRSHDLTATVGAFVTITDDLALEQARAADRQVAESADPQTLPVLHGVVVPVKDLNEVKGVRCRFGSVVTDVISPLDDDMVLLLREGGTIMTGKTSTPEFGLPCYTEPDVADWSRTPWDLERSAGGSSGGAAAAVASGLAPVAQGSDGGGSIRIPASVCGLVGLKASRGLVPSGPNPESQGRLEVNGPLARTVTDVAALLDVMTGRGPADSYLRNLESDPEPLLIGRYRQPVIADTTVHPDCILAYEQTSMLLESLGHHVVDIDVPFPLSAVVHFERVWAALAAAIPIPPERESELRPLTRWLRGIGRGLSLDEVTAAVDLMAGYGRAALDATSHLDIILTPTLADLPALIGSLRDDEDPVADFLAQKRFTPFTSPYNITGQPAVSLPLHWTKDGLPVGVQLVGQPMAEATVLRLAAQLERARPWVDRHPEVW